jgi:hypothetical protein
MWDDVNNKRDLRKICSGDVNLTVLVQGRVQWWAFCDNSYESLSYKEIIYQLNNNKPIEYIPVL